MYYGVGYSRYATNKRLKSMEGRYAQFTINFEQVETRGNWVRARVYD